MEIAAEVRDKVTILTIDGSLDATTADQVMDRINLELSAASERGEQGANLVIDLDKVDFMSSAGLRAILAGTQDARKAKGDMRMAGGSHNIKRMLEFSGFTKIMKFYDTVDEAVQSFAN